MNGEASPSQGPRITWVEILAGAIALLLLLSLISLFLPACSRISSKGNITKGISNCRQIILALKLYASDHGGKYPDAALADPKSANEVLRILFKEEKLSTVKPSSAAPSAPSIQTGTLDMMETAVRRSKLERITGR